MKPFSATVLILTFSPAGLRRVDAGEHLAQLAPAGDRVEFVRVERVERDVDALDPAAGKLGGKARQLRAVGGQGQLVERARLPDAATAGAPDA